jgi:ABC transport system ATP-binding/permease protein
MGEKVYLCKMHYLSVEKLTKSYGIQPLFNDISFNVEEGDKIAIIAKNGYGKSTLLKILAGKEYADSGKVWIHKDVTVALFEQEPNFDESSTIIENIFSHDHPILNAIKEYELVSEQEDMDKLTDAIVKMDDMGAWTFDAKVKEILEKLKINHLDQPVKTLSGGQRKRVALAKTLIDIGFEHKHVLLIMDEPTNHLDVEMVEWLEYYLSQEKITLLLVTHDRYFLDAVCEEIWELDRSELFVYRGDYENYIEKKAARLDNEQANIDKAKNTFRKELEWMRKQPKARTTKSKSRQDNFYDIEAIAKKRIEDNKVQLAMKMNRLGGKIVELKKVYKSFGDKKIMNGFDYNFARGERVGVIGKNGAGKSTFINILQGLEQVDTGKINHGDTVVFGNYSQAGLVIKEDMRVIEFVKNIAENFPLADGSSLSAAKFLELFLFEPDKQFTYISKLSGGEKRRLHLLSILFKNPNFLILDEPTNDLDLPTLAVLENFLNDFPGCLLIVSHDRYFMDRLVDHLFVFEGNGVINDFPGNYNDYRLSSNYAERSTNHNVKETKEEEIKKEVVIKESVVPIAPKRMSFKEKREFELLQKEISDLQKEKEALSLQLQSGETDFTILQKASERIGEITAIIDEKEFRWLELSEMEG